MLDSQTAESGTTSLFVRALDTQVSKYSYVITFLTRTVFE